MIKLTGSVLSLLFIEGCCCFFLVNFVAPCDSKDNNLFINMYDDPFYNSPERKEDNLSIVRQKKLTGK